MRLPILSAPVKRPNVIPPHRVVDVVSAYEEYKNLPFEERLDAEYNNIYSDLMHGANFNDPQYFQYRTYQQVMSSACGRGCFSCLKRA